MASLKQQQASKCLLFLTWIPHVSQGKGEQTEANALKEVERLKKKLAQQKRNNQKLAEFVQGMSHFCSHRETCLMLLTQESHGDVDTADLSLESEEMDDCHRYDFWYVFTGTDLIFSNFLNFILHLGLITTPHVHMTYVYSISHVSHFTRSHGQEKSSSYYDPFYDF